MKKKIIITYEELMTCHDWEKACELLGISVWCVNEGLVSKDDEVALTEEQAIAIGIL